MYCSVFSKFNNSEQEEEDIEDKNKFLNRNQVMAYTDTQAAMSQSQMQSMSITSLHDSIASTQQHEEDNKEEEELNSAIKVINPP